MQTQHNFFASLLNLNENEHTAKFYIMNTSPNRNRWGVTAQALDEALPTLIAKKIGLGKDYKTEKHFERHRRQRIHSSIIKTSGIRFSNCQNRRR